MGKRSTTSATIHFGLVAIPVKFYLTASPDNVSFNLFTAAGNRVKMKFIDGVTGDAVVQSECSKGYEYEKGKHVLFSQTELQQLGESDNGSLEIKEFVPASSIDSLRIEKSHYLDAGKGGDKAYRLFVAALKQRNVVAIGQWISKGRENLVAIVAKGDALVVHTLYYDNEMREIDVSCATYTPREAELNMAGQLIDALTHDAFDSSKYVNTFTTKVKTAVEQKLAGDQVSVEQVPKTEENSDLFAALLASVKAGAA